MRLLTRPVRLLRPVLSIATLVWLGAAFFAPATFAESRKPLVLDTQTGISDGQSGTVLQTAPLSHAPIAPAQPIASPTELAPNSAPPIVVSPYVEMPGAGSTAPQPRARPAPRQQ